MRRLIYFGVVSIIVELVNCEPTLAAISGLQQVATGLSSPMFVTHAPGDRNRLYIGQRNGVVRILNLVTGTLEASPFLTISGVDQEGEGGLLGMAFHPDYATNGKFYVNVTIDNGGIPFQGIASAYSTHIRQYTALGNPLTATGIDPDPTKTSDILKIVHPQSNHAAGWIGFSPNNGLLYIPTGDGGGGNDLDHDGDSDGHTPGTGNAQDITDNLLGKILRIDVNSDDFPADPNRNYHIPPGNPYAGATTGDDEIWAIGMRNPFRDSFDRSTGNLWLGDVGQSTREEIDRQLSNAPGGQNFGWRLREGLDPNPTAGIGGAKPANNVDPAYDYGRTGTFGGKTVIGGYVYRGPDPDLQGKYFFADTGDFGNAASNKFWTFNSADVPAIPGSPEPTATDIKPLLIPNTGAPSFPSAFGEDAVGNLYIVYLETNQVYRIATNNLLRGDFDADGDVDQADYTKWRAGMGGANLNPASDGNGNAVFDAADYVAWRKNLGQSVLAGAGSGAAEIPEPGAMALLSLLVMLAGCRPRQRCAV